MSQTDGRVFLPQAVRRTPGTIVSIRERADGSATVRWRDTEDGEVGDFHISKAALNHPTNPDYMAHEMRQRAAFEQDNSR
jgi:hypothetical protein